MGKIFDYDGVPVLHTTSGDLKGYFYDGVYIYKGIPYAYADRFQMPVPSKWDGVKDATNYGFVCPLQNQDTPNGELMVPHRYWPQDEHCQSLNIWTNKLDPEAKKPVLVWFHGGGYAAGSSIEQVAYDGVSIAKKGDSILVSVNHRLNILGYLDLSPFGEKYKNSANAGHADMVAALQWVRDKMIGGEAAIGVIYSGEIMYIQDEVAAQNLPFSLEYVIPEEGTNVWLDSWVVPKNAKNKENAEKWINFLCRPDVAVKNFEYITYATPNKAAKEMLDEEIQNNKAVFPDAKQLKNCEVYRYLGDEADELYNSLWKEVKSD